MISEEDGIYTEEQYLELIRKKQEKTDFLDEQARLFRQAHPSRAVVEITDPEMLGVPPFLRNEAPSRKP